MEVSSNTLQDAMTQALRPRLPTTTAPTDPPATEPLALRITEAVRVSGFSRSRLYLMAARGEIIFLKCGKAVLVEYASLKAAIQNLPRAAIKEAA
jgi:hypothetical protein